MPNRREAVMLAEDLKGSQYGSPQGGQRKRGSVEQAVEQIELFSGRRIRFWLFSIFRVP